MQIRVSGVASLGLVSIVLTLLGACSSDGGTGVVTPQAGASGKSAGATGGSAGAVGSSGGTESDAGSGGTSSSGGPSGSGSGGDRNESGAGGSVNEAGAGGAGTSGSGGFGSAGEGGSVSGAGGVGEAGSAGAEAGSGGANGGAAHCLRPYERHTLESLKEASTEGACNNDADFEAVCATDLVTVSARCAFQCSSAKDNRQCVGKCIRKTAKPPTSETCTVCYTDVVECIVKNCVSICLDDPWGLPCRDCRRKNGCSQGFMSCSGLPDPN